MSLLRNLRSLLSHSRVPIRVGLNPDAKIRHVRFVPDLRPKKALLKSPRWILVTLAVFSGYSVVKILAEDGSIHIPLGFPKLNDKKRFLAGDPTNDKLWRFSADRVRKKRAERFFEDRCCEIVKKAIKDVGANIESRGSLLFFHYPVGPLPEYKQKVIRVVSARVPPPEKLIGIEPPAGNWENFAEGQKLFQIGDLIFESTTRYIHRDRMLRYDNAFNPTWMFRAIKNSVLSVYYSGTYDKDVEGVTEAIKFGGATAMTTLKLIKKELGTSRQRPPPGEGHVLVDGIVQVSGKNKFLTLDITASFDPDNFNDYDFQKLKVRYAVRLTPYNVTRSPMEAQSAKTLLAIGEDLIEAGRELKRASASGKPSISEAARKAERSMEEQHRRLGELAPRKIEQQSRPQIRRLPTSEKSEGTELVDERGSRAGTEGQDLVTPKDDAAVEASKEEQKKKDLQQQDTSASAPPPPDSPPSSPPS